MAKHFYHIPLQKTLAFIKEHKSELARLIKEKKALAYQQQLGKSYYTLQVEIFINFFKIDKELDYALKTMEYFHSTLFMHEAHKILNFSQFDLAEHKVDIKAFFYAFCYVYEKCDPKGFEHFMQKTFIHYHSAFNSESNIHINYKEMCHTLAKSKKVTLKESFGEEKDEAFFKIFVDKKAIVEEKGKRIKTLRKKAYKHLFYYLVELDEQVMNQAEEAYNNMKSLSSL